MSETILTWLKNGNPRSGVNFRPLPKGNWDGVMWGSQQHRCSNNVPLGGPVVSPTWYEFIAPITWSISGTNDNPAQIFFDLEIDQPGTDLIILKDQNVNMHVGSSNQWATTKGTDAHPRGLYISNVRGATMTFSLAATVPDPAPVV